jgi:hypothetical protein
MAQFLDRARAPQPRSGSEARQPARNVGGLPPRVTVEPASHLSQEVVTAGAHLAGPPALLPRRRCETEGPAERQALAGAGLIDRGATREPRRGLILERE